MKTGYHYTTLENWKSIRRMGLRPYRIQKPELRGCLPNDRGVWLWRKRLTGLSHAGSIIFTCAQKAVTHVVLLRVRYDPADVPSHDRDGIPITLCGHVGNIGELVYHDSEPYTIVTAVIPPEQIELIGSYDLVAAFAKEQNGALIGIAP